jgi:hypothetical protein
MIAAFFADDRLNRTKMPEKMSCYKRQWELGAQDEITIEVASWQWCRVPLLALRDTSISALQRYETPGWFTHELPAECCYVVIVGPRRVGCMCVARRPSNLQMQCAAPSRVVNWERNLPSRRSITGARLKGEEVRCDLMNGCVERRT